LMKSIDTSGRSITSGASEAIEQLDKSITAQIERLKELNNVASQVAVRKDLLAAALKRYQAISEVSMNDFNNIETSDIESQRLQKGINTYQLDPPEGQETA
jgi:hypothetical protein